MKVCSYLPSQYSCTCHQQKPKLTQKPKNYTHQQNFLVQVRMEKLLARSLFRRPHANDLVAFSVFELGQKVREVPRPYIVSWFSYGFRIK